MKKLLFGCLLFFCCLSLSKAQTFYSDYSDYGEYTEQVIQESDTIFVQKERRYKWYKDNKILGDYYPIASNVSNFPEVDLNDSYETPFSEWSIVKPNFNFYRVTESRDVYAYKDSLPIKFLHFYDLRGGNGYLGISELEIYNQDTKISYTVLDNNPDFVNRLQDGNLYDDTNLIVNNSRITIDLNGEYHLDDLKVKLYLYDETTIQKDIKAKFTHSQNFSNQIIASLYIIHLFTYKNVDQIEPIIYTSKDWKKYPVTYGEVQYSEKYPEEKKGRVINKTTQYRYKDTLFRYYRINRDYLVDYYAEAPGDYLKDSTQYKDFYRCKKRDKIEISDDLVFTDYDKSLTSLILETTLKDEDIEIISDFDINKNGKYQVKFVLPFKTIVKTVTVDILQNEINELNNKLINTEQQLKDSRLELSKSEEELLKLTDTLEQLKKAGADEKETLKQEAKIIALEKRIKELLKEINQLDDKRIKYNEELETLLVKKKNQTQINENKSEAIFYLKYWLWAIIIVLLALIIGYIIKTKKLSYQN